MQETHANTMVPIEQRVAALGPAPLLWQDAQQVCLPSAMDQSQCMRADSLVISHAPAFTFAFASEPALGVCP